MAGVLFACAKLAVVEPKPAEEPVHGHGGALPDAASYFEFFSVCRCVSRLTAIPWRGRCGIAFSLGSGLALIFLRL